MRGTGKTARRRAFGVAFAVGVIAAFAPRESYAGETVDETTSSVCEIGSGAWELGFNGAVISRAGSVNSTIALFSNRFWTFGNGAVLSAGAVASYSRVSDLDLVDLEALLAAYKRLSRSSAYIYAGVGGGVRQEWVGSFSQARYPVGVDAGIKTLVSRRAAVTVTYQYRRMLNDPVEDFNEHRFVIGISIFLRNEKG